MELMHLNAPTTICAVTDESSAHALTGGINANYIILTNENDFPIYVKLGEANTVAATVLLTIVPAKSQVSYRKEINQDYLAAIADTGNSGNLRVQCGAGI